MPDHRDAPLAVTAVAYSLAHHLGSLPDGLGPAGRGTRVTDWVDLLVPFVVLLPALGTLLAARPGRASYLWFAVGSWLYATGHGVHLAANSVGNVAPGETAHLWDEQVGHWLWYAGAAVVFATLAATLRGRRPPVTSAGRAGAVLLALAVGVTWGTNAAGGHFVVPALILDAAAVAWGVRHRGERAGLTTVVGLGGLLGAVLAALL